MIEIASNFIIFTLKISSQNLFFSELGDGRQIDTTSVCRNNLYREVRHLSLSNFRILWFFNCLLLIKPFLTFEQDFVLKFQIRNNFNKFSILRFSERNFSTRQVRTQVLNLLSLEIELDCALRSWPQSYKIVEIVTFVFLFKTYQNDTSLNCWSNFGKLYFPQFDFNLKQFLISSIKFFCLKIYQGSISISVSAWTLWSRRSLAAST